LVSPCASARAFVAADPTSSAVDRLREVWEGLGSQGIFAGSVLAAHSSSASLISAAPCRAKASARCPRVVGSFATTASWTSSRVQLKTRVRPKGTPVTQHPADHSARRVEPHHRHAGVGKISGQYGRPPERHLRGGTDRVLATRQGGHGCTVTASAVSRRLRPQEAQPRARPVDDVISLLVHGRMGAWPWRRKPRPSRCTLHCRPERLHGDNRGAFVKECPRGDAYPHARQPAVGKLPLYC
jgi:hypothetical protein